MGLMLSILVVCVGVIEALSCFEHFQYGVIHCATNVYETARRRSSVFLKYTSRRLKLLPENSVFEYDERAETNVFQPIKMGYCERKSKLSEVKYDPFDRIRKPKAVRISERPAKTLEKEDKIQIVKTLLERPRRPPTVRSVSMPELVHTEEDIELSKIINDLAVEPIEEIDIEIEEGNCEVLTRKFDELFNENERGERSLDNYKNLSDDLEHFEETKFPQIEAVCDFNVKSMSKEIENVETDEENLNSNELSLVGMENDEQSLIPDDKSVKGEDDFLKMIPEKEKPITGVIKTNISQKVSDKGADYFKETLRKFSLKTDNRFDRSISVDFNKVPSMRINKPTVDFLEMSNEMKLISEESISLNKLEDIILENDTPPGEIIDKTFEEIYENICDESSDAANTFAEIEKNILEDVVTVESQGSPSPVPCEPEVQFIFPENHSEEGETSLSSGKTVPTAVFLKAIRQLAQLLVSDSLNLCKIKNLILENLNNVNNNGKLHSVDKLDAHLQSQRENKCESHNVEGRIPGESVQELPDMKNLIRAKENSVPNDERPREELTKTILVKMYEVTDVPSTVTEEFVKMGCFEEEGGIPNVSVAGLGVANVGSDQTVVNPKDVLGVLKSERVPEVNSTSKDNFENEIPISFPQLGDPVTDVENRTESSFICDETILDVVEKNGQSNKLVGNAKEEVRDKIEKNEEALEYVEKVEPEMKERKFSEIMETKTAPSLLLFPTQNDILPTETEKKMITETHIGFPQPDATTVLVEGKMEPHVKDDQNQRTQDEIKVINQSNKGIDITNTETKVLDESPREAELEKPKENEKINVNSEICTQFDTCVPGLDVSENVEFKEEINYEPNDVEKVTMIEQDINKIMEELEKQLVVDQKCASPSKDVVETVHEPIPEETKKLKENLKSKSTVAHEIDAPGHSNIVIEIVESRPELLLALEQKTVVQSQNDKKEVAVDQNSASPNKEEVEPVQEQKSLPEETKKLEENLKSEITVAHEIAAQGHSDIVIDTVELKYEPLLTLEQKTILQPEEDKKLTELLTETDKINKMEGIPLVVDDKKIFFTNQEAVTDFVEEHQEEKPLPVKTEKPINSVNSEITVRRDATTPEGDSNVISEVIQAGQPEKESLPLEFKGENNTSVLFSQTVGDEEESKKLKGKVPRDSVKPEQAEQPVLKFHDKNGEFVENMEFPVDNTEAKNADKSRSDTTNNSESTKTSLEGKMGSPVQDDQNARTQKGIEIKKQSNETVFVINTEVKIVDEKSTLLPNKEENLKEEKPEELEIFQQSVKPDTSLGCSDLEESIQTMKAVEQNEAVNTEENKNEKNLEREKNIKMEEVRPGDIVKQSGEPALKFHDKPGETKDKMEFEQVDFFEGNNADKLHIHSKNETEPASLGTSETKEKNSKNSNLSESNEATSSAPEAFWLIFSGEYTKAMSKDWHSGHFSCWQCDEALTGQRYVLRDDHPYCIKCYESVFANVCEECNKIIGIDSKDLSYKDKHWHEACFLCNKCRVSLVDKQFGSKADKIYCGNCYDAQFASRCDGCGEIFRAGTKKMEYKTRQWHEKCFCCCVCKTPIGTKSFIPREQEIYCATCYEEKFATRCVKCNKIITSGGVTYKNEPWHRECFTCTNCNTSLAGQRFTSRDEKPYCADCFGELFAKRCTACSRPITGIGGTRFISFEDRHWHNDCFICASCKTSLVGRGFITDGDDIICPECAKQKLM